MPSPGETFPMQFALGILQLKQQRDQQAAQLTEMRNQRASSNFLEKERLRIQEQGQNLQAEQFGESLAAQQERAKLEADAQREAASARIGLEVEKIKAERQQGLERQLADFSRTGSAFVPSWAAGKVPQLMGEAASATNPNRYTTIDLPGLGTIVQRIDPKDVAVVDKIEAQIGDLKSRSALNSKRQELIDFQKQEKVQRIQAGVANIDLASQRIARDRQAELRKRADAARTTAILAGQDEKAARIGADPREAFDEGSPARQAWDSYEEIQAAFAEQQARKINAPERPNLPALDAAGWSTHLFGPLPGAASTPAAAQQQSTETIIGFAQRHRPTSIPGALGGAVRSRVLYTSTGRQIDVPADLPTPERGQLLSSYLGTGSGPAPPSAPETPAPPASSSETTQAEFDAIKTQYLNTLDAATYARLQALKKQYPTLR